MGARSTSGPRFGVHDLPDVELSSLLARDQHIEKPKGLHAAREALLSVFCFYFLKQARNQSSGSIRTPPLSAADAKAA